MSLLHFNKPFHKWLSLLVGLQLLIWLATGLYFNLSDHDLGSGNEHRQRVVHQGSVSTQALLPISTLNIKNAQQVSLLWILQQPYYQVVYQQQPHRYQTSDIELYQALNGDKFELDATLAADIAVQSLTQKAEVVKTKLVLPPIAELPREQNPLWQVSFNDDNQTNVYVDNSSGRVIAHVNNDRRLRDLMFKLHFMDYGNSGGFNHWLIILFAIGTLVLVISGVIWLVELYQNGLLSLSFIRGKQKITLTDSRTGVTTEVLLPKDKTVFEGLAQANIMLPSTCGGGGICGRCAFVSSQSLTTTSADRARITAEELALGYRLGCQHKAAGIKALTLSQLTRKAR